MKILKAALIERPLLPVFDKHWRWTLDGVASV